MEKSILECIKINKYFYDPVKIQVLKEVSIDIKKSEFVSITGKSGCGKSTLVSLLLRFYDVDEG